jgi:hypothetical protein
METMTEADKIKAFSRLPGQLFEAFGWIEPDIYWDMHSALLDRLRSGNLGAFGIREKPSPSEKAVPLPAKLFEPEFVKWQKSRVEGDGEAYRRVVVTRRKSVETSVSAELSRPTKSPAQPGPKSAETVIIELFHEMRKSGRFPETYTKKQVHALMLPTLRKEFGANFPGGRGLSYANVAKHLGRIADF